MNETYQELDQAIIELDRFLLEHNSDLVSLRTALRKPMEQALAALSILSGRMRVKDPESAHPILQKKMALILDGLANGIPSIEKAEFVGQLHDFSERLQVFDAKLSEIQDVDASRSPFGPHSK